MRKIVHTCLNFTRTCDQNFSVSDFWFHIRCRHRNEKMFNAICQHSLHIWSGGYDLSHKLSTCLITTLSPPSSSCLITNKFNPRLSRFNFSIHFESIRGNSLHTDYTSFSHVCTSNNWRAEGCLAGSSTSMFWTRWIRRSASSVVQLFSSHSQCSAQYAFASATEASKTSSRYKLQKNNVLVPTLLLKVGIWGPMRFPCWWDLQCLLWYQENIYLNYSS